MSGRTMPAQRPGKSKQDYSTPAAFIAAVERRLGITSFLFDFAADTSNFKAPRYWTKRHDALGFTPRKWAQQVDGGWGWLNPEFADIEPWAEACQGTRAHGGSVALLTPAAVGSNWFRDYVDGHARVLLLNGRLCFIENWRETLNPATLKPGKGPPRFYESEPLYPKDCIPALYSPRVKPGYEVWTWRDLKKS